MREFNRFNDRKTFFDMGRKKERDELKTKISLIREKHLDDNKSLEVIEEINLLL